MEDNAIIELFFERSEQAIRELDGSAKYEAISAKCSQNLDG